jgi:hypothetical protein
VHDIKYDPILLNLLQNSKYPKLNISVKQIIEYDFSSKTLKRGNQEPEISYLMSSHAAAMVDEKLLKYGFDLKAPYIERKVYQMGDLVVP